MEYNLIDTVRSCRESIEQGPMMLVYLSHVPVAIAALALGTFVYYRDRSLLTNRLLLALGIAFSTWTVLSLFTWTSADSRVIMSAWSLLGVADSFTTLLAAYFFYVFARNKDLSFAQKVLLAFLPIPLIVFLPTQYNLDVFDAVACEAIEPAPYMFYYYFLGFLSFFWVIYTAISEYARLGETARRQLVLMTLGIGSFLFLFTGLGSLTSYLYSVGMVEDYNLMLYGMFGMPIFLGLVAYLMVHYGAFHAKLAATHALVAALIMLVGAEFFLVRGWYNYLLMTLTMMIVVVFARGILRSVRMEIKRAQELRGMADKLRALNNAKTEFVSIASHQLRTPLSTVKGYTSLLLEGDLGPVSEPVTDVVKKISTSNERLIRLVEDLLSVSRIESGKMQYSFGPCDLRGVVREVVDFFAQRAKEKSIDLVFSDSGTAGSEIIADEGKIREVVVNIVDNAVKFTPRGSIHVVVADIAQGVRITVTDSGVGLDRADIPYLFEKFSRGREHTKSVAEGTGLGLFVARSIVLAHGGRIWAESDGPERGSRFIVDLPRKPTNMSGF